METLQRIYGISFPDPKMLKEWEKFQEEAKNRDHRKLGRVGSGSERRWRRRTSRLNNSILWGYSSILYVEQLLEV